MCAVPTSGMGAALQAIDEALEAKLNGSSGLFNSLIIRLSKNNDETVCDLLHALARYAVVLSDHNDRRSPALRLLVDAALRFDFLAHAENRVELVAMEFFTLNLISASASHVEPVIVMIVRVFSKAGDIDTGALHPYFHSVLQKILATYPHCSGLLVRILKSNFPHHVRPINELQSYTRFLLCVAEYVQNHMHRERLIDVVVEKMAIVDAYVPSDAAVVAVDGEPSPQEGETFQEESFADTDPTLRKMDVLLLETCEFLSRVSQRPKPNILFSQVFDSFVNAYSARVVPMYKARFVPFSILYAAHCAGQEPVRWLVESLRQSFFDERLTKGSRVSFVQHSAALICRARCYESFEALAWLNSLLSWLHSYLDFAEVKGRGRRVIADADQHRLFYGAIAAVMYVMWYRRDALNCSSELPSNVIARMRILRLLRSRLNPLRILPGSLTERFASLICEQGGVDLDEVLQRSSRQSIASKTCFNNLNFIQPFFPLEPPGLPSFAMYLKGAYRERPEFVTAGDSQGNEKKTLHTVPTTSASRLRCRLREAAEVPMLNRSAAYGFS